MDATLFNAQVDKLVAKIKHYLITRQGKLFHQVSDEEIFDALSMSLREEVMINWSTAYNTYQKKNSRMLYYLSMEYLPGKILDNTIKNLESEELSREALKRLNRDFDHVVHCEREPGLGNGGLGRLASCFLDSLATLKIPTIAYGLRYQYGTFEQEICYGSQVERPDRWLLRAHPWEFRRDYRTYQVKFGGHTPENGGEESQFTKELMDYEEVMALCYDIPIVGYSKKDNFSVATQRLWSTKESPRNFRLQTFNAGNLNEAAENMILTDVLYPNDNHEVGKRIRLKQEYLLVSASLQDILSRHLACNPDLKNLPDKVCIQINDTHPTLIIAELIRLLMQQHNFEWNDAWETTQHCMNYTNHTVMVEALEEWSVERFKDLLPRQYAIILKLNEQFKKSLPLEKQEEESFEKLSLIHNDQIRMANLAIYGSCRVNGVAKLHTEILKAGIFKDFYEIYPEKFLNVTNGVTPRRWLFHANPLLTQFITERIGEEWMTDFKQISRLHDFAEDRDSILKFLEIKKKNKERASEYITKYNQEFRSYDPFVNNMLPLGPDSLFDMHIKRIHEYKRQLLKLIHLIIHYQELLEDPKSHPVKRTAIFAGKAAPGYQKARDLIYLIHIIARKVNQDPATQDSLRILFIENYNVSKAEILIPSADLSQQISLAGKEASGTGNMKLAMNGALTIGTDDGANVEMREAVTDTWWPFLFGCDRKEVESFKENMNYYPKAVYDDDPKVKKALNALLDKTFTQNEFEEHLLHQVYHYLLEGFNPDPYLVLHDLESYYQTQKKVEELYSQPEEWGKYALHNIASMAPFSSDESIRNYNDQVWKIQPEELDPEIHSQTQNDFQEVDQCYIGRNGSSDKEK